MQRWAWWALLFLAGALEYTGDTRIIGGMVLVWLFGRCTERDRLRQWRDFKSAHIMSGEEFMEAYRKHGGQPGQADWG